MPCSACQIGLDAESLADYLHNLRVMCGEGANDMMVLPAISEQPDVASVEALLSVLDQVRGLGVLGF
jgi:hypothetical protein